MTLDIRALLLHVTRLWPESGSTMLWNLSFKEVRQIYNSLDMETDRKTPEKDFSGAELQNYPLDYHTWVCTVFLLEAPL